jgi:hypothetical protein
MGNQAMQRRLIQAKRTGKQPGDSFEPEADQVAELTGHGGGPMLLSAATPSQSAVGSLQRLHGNQSVLQMRHGSSGRPVPLVPLRPSLSGILQRKCACGGAAGMSGECEECSKKQQLGLQTKLKVNEPGDIYEQEADRVADQVTAMSAPPAVSGAPPSIQRFAGPLTGQSEAAPASVDQVLASPGRPLEQAIRQDMEQRFGYDFSRVRVHTDGAAEQSAKDVNAHAYTVGHHIVFGADRFAPGTQEGRRLVAHELSHVVQQSILGRSALVPHSSDRREDVKDLMSRTRIGLLESADIPKLTSATIQIARAPKVSGDTPGIHPDTMAFLENKLRQFFELLSPSERIRLKRNSTIAIGMATVDREPRLVYTVANNGTSKEIRAAADKLDLHRWTYTTGVPGRGAVGAPNDAEQLMTEFAKDNHADLHGIAVSRRVCPDCGEAIPLYKRGQIQVSVIEDPIPVPRGPRLAPLQPPAGAVGGEIIVPQRGAVTPAGGGSSRAVTATSGEIIVPQRGAVTPAGGGPSRAVTTASGEIIVPGSAGRAAIRTGVGIGLQTLLFIVFWWLGKKAAEEEQKWLEELVAKQLDPAVGKALIDQSTTIYRLTAEDPSHPLYANVTADFNSHWTETGIAGNPEAEHVTEIRFVDMKFSSQNLKNEQQISKESSTVLFSQYTNVWATKRVSFSLLVFHPEFEVEKARQLKAWEEYVEKNPGTLLKPFKPVRGKAADSWRWLHEVSAIQQWLVDRKLHNLRKELGMERE